MVLAPKERLSEPRGWAVIKPDDLRRWERSYCSQRRRSIRYARADRHPGTHQLRKQLGALADHNRVREHQGAPRRSRSQSYSQIALLHSHLCLHDQLTFADISGTDNGRQRSNISVPCGFLSGFNLMGGACAKQKKFRCGTLVNSCHLTLSSAGRGKPDDLSTD
jgi:hypothetical protein